MLSTMEQYRHSLRTLKNLYLEGLLGFKYFLLQVHLHIRQHREPQVWWFLFKAEVELAADLNQQQQGLLAFALEEMQVQSVDQD